MRVPIFARWYAFPGASRLISPPSPYERLLRWATRRRKKHHQ